MNYVPRLETPSTAHKTRPQFSWEKQRHYFHLSILSLLVIFTPFCPYPPRFECPDRATSVASPKWQAAAGTKRKPIDMKHPNAYSISFLLFDKAWINSSTFFVRLLKIPLYSYHPSLPSEKKSIAFCHTRVPQLSNPRRFSWFSRSYSPFLTL